MQNRSGLSPSQIANILGSHVNILIDDDPDEYEDASLVGINAQIEKVGAKALVCRKTKNITVVYLFIADSNIGFTVYAREGVVVTADATHPISRGIAVRNQSDPVDSSYAEGLAKIRALRAWKIGKSTEPILEKHTKKNPYLMDAHLSFSPSEMPEVGKLKAGQPRKTTLYVAKSAYMPTPISTERQFLKYWQDNVARRAEREAKLVEPISPVEDTVDG